MTPRHRIQKQYSAVLAGLAVGLILGLAGLLWLDSRVLLLVGMAVLAATIVAGERLIRCPVCGQSVYAEVAREAAFTPGGVPRICPKCAARWTSPDELKGEERP